MVKIILIKSPDEWATTKQACRDELEVYLSFSSHNIYVHRSTPMYWALFYVSQILHFIYIQHLPLLFSSSFTFD